MTAFARVKFTQKTRRDRTPIHVRAWYAQTKRKRGKRGIESPWRAETGEGEPHMVDWQGRKDQRREKIS